MKPPQTKAEIKEQLTHLIESANEEELLALQAVLDGLQKKRDGKTMTFLEGVLGFKSRVLENGQLEMFMPNHPLVRNRYKITHGGYTATLLDTAFGWVLQHHLPKHLGIVTMEIKLNYIRPSKGEYLRSVASVVHIGKKIAVVEGKVYDDNEQLVASGSGSFFIFTLNK